MNEAATPRPLDSSEYLATLLSEQGMTPDEISATLPWLSQLDTWAAPELSAGETARLVQRLLPLVPARTAPRTRWQELIELLALARLQVRVVRPAFWLSSASILLLGLLLVLGSADGERTLLLYVMGPLLGYLGTASAFREVGLGLLECELACPPSARQLTMARLAVVLGYLVVLGMAASLLLGINEQNGFRLMTLHWLAPLLLGVGTTLVLSLRLPILHAASLVYVVWLAFLVLRWQVGGGSLPAALGAPVEVLLCAAGLVLAFVAVLALPAALLRPTSRQVA